MKTIFIICMLIAFTYTELNAQCLPNDTIANQNTIGTGSLCGMVPCENMNFNDGDVATFYTTIACRKILSLTDSVDGINLGNVSVCENIDCMPTLFSGQPVLNRSFKITPTNNGKAYVSLYILQWDIDEFNTASFPTGPFLDPMLNLSIIQLDTTFNMGTPISSITYIPNSSITTNYDTMNTAWTISFPVDSFSNFFISTPANIFPASISNYDADELIKLSPNPANNNLNLEMEAKGEYESYIEITDITGRIMKAVKLIIKKGLNSNNIDISALQSGSYLVSITTGSGSNFSQIIIKR
jgi:hypothetical protein